MQNAPRPLPMVGSVINPGPMLNHEETAFIARAFQWHPWVTRSVVRFALGRSVELEGGVYGGIMSRQALGNALAGALFFIIAIVDFARDSSGIGVVFLVFAAVPLGDLGWASVPSPETTETCRDTSVRSEARGSRQVDLFASNKPRARTSLDQMRAPACRSLGRSFDPANLS